MDRVNFYKIYLPALQKALDNDNSNHGFFVYPPEYYIDKMVEREVEYCMDVELGTDVFIQQVEEYFDAKSHYALDVRGVPIQLVKEKILNEMHTIERSL